MATTINANTSNAIRAFLLEETGSETGTFFGRIPAARQRAAFGAVLFGKRTVRIDGEAGEAMTYRKVCFGTDYDIEIFTLSNE